MSKGVLKNPFEEEGKWYKANLHTHTTVSDGLFTPEEQVRAYKGKGYCILAITDHGAVTDAAGLSSGDFLVISGMEGHGQEGDVFYHVVALNVPNDFAFIEEEGIHRFVSKVNAAGGLAFMAHPYWLGLESDDMLKLDGIAAFEVFNAVCGGPGKSTASVHWDNLLMKGARMPALAVDDAHWNGYDIFGGWAWFKLRELSTEAVMGALRSGCFYSSTGPEIKDISVSDEKIRVECSPMRSVTFFAQRWYGARIMAEEGKTISEAEYELTGEEEYVRIECTDAEGKTAWSNPFFF